MMRCLLPGRRILFPAQNSLSSESNGIVYALIYVIMHIDTPCSLWYIHIV